MLRCCFENRSIIVRSTEQQRNHLNFICSFRYQIFNLQKPEKSFKIHRCFIKDQTSRFQQNYHERHLLFLISQGLILIISFSLAKIHSLGKTNDSLECFQQALRINPESISAQQGIDMILQENSADIQRNLIQTQTQNNLDQDELINKGKHLQISIQYSILLQTNQLKEALIIFDKLLTVNQQPEVIFYKAQTLQLNNDTLGYFNQRDMKKHSFIVTFQNLQAFIRIKRNSFQSKFLAK